MSKHYHTYSSVDHDGNDILYIGYNEDGDRIKERVRFEPEIFLETTDQSSEYRTLNNVLLKRKEFDTIGSCRDYVKQYSDIYRMYGCSDYVRQFIGRRFRGELKAAISNIAVWFFDIETRVGDSGFPDPKTANEEISLVTMVHRKTRKIHTWGLHAIDDPLVNGKQTSDQVEDDYKKIRELGVDYRSFSDEASMLKDFLMFVKTNAIDVLSGWNSEFFDIPFLYNRLVRVLGESLANHLSPWKIVSEKQIMMNDKAFQSFEISGINHLDLLDLYKKFNPGSKESFSLDFISNFELGTQKVELPGENFRDSYENYWSTFVYYNIIDTMLVLQIDEKKQLVDLCMGVAYMAKCNFTDVVSAMRTWESFIFNYFLERNIIEDWSKKKSTRESLEGAYVKEPIPGRYKWVVSVDATSMYPSIMMQNNLSPETIITQLDDFDSDKFVACDFPSLDPTHILSANGLITSNQVNGFIPQLTRFVFDGRKEAKNRMLELKSNLKKIKDATEKFETEKEIAALNTRQNALKVLGNALYGVCALPHFRYYKHAIAEAITTCGKSYLKMMIVVLNDVLNRLCKTKGVDYVFYGDTDSLFFTLDKFVELYCSKLKDDKEITAYIEKFVKNVIQPEMNSKLEEVSKQINAPENMMFFKLEGISKNAIWLAKKRYCTALLYNEGVWYDPPEYKIMGMEIVRSSTPKLIKEKLRSAVEICNEGQEFDLQEFVQSCKEDFMKREIEEIAFPRGCNGLSVYADENTIYKPKTPAHVRAALLHNRMIETQNLKIKPIGEGEKIKFVYLKMPNPIHENIIAFVGKLPSEFGLDSYVCKETMFEKGFIAPLEGVLEAIKWDWEEKNTLDF